MQSPLCEVCLSKGVITPAFHAHHIDSFMNYEGMKRKEVAYNPDNLMSICEQCHQKVRECNLNSVWFLFLLNHNKYNFFFLDLQMLLKVVFGCVQGRRRMSRLYTLAHIRELPFLCV